MGATDGLSPLAPDDAEPCLALSVEAGWNQIAADWRMMLAAGAGFALRDKDGAPQASGIALPMGAGFGWISMILVTRALRRQGHARRLMAACIDRLEGAGRAACLDATAEGQPLYASLGFRPVAQVLRMAGAGTGAGHATHPGLRPFGAEDQGWIAALDRDAIAGDRSFMLRDFVARPGRLALVRDTQDGFVLGRQGRLATQIGPIVARTPEIAADLLAAALDHVNGPVFVDAMAQQPLAKALGARGFAEQRSFLRMVRGKAPWGADTARLFAAAGPELG